jgi:hypothetical protein
MSTIKGYIMFNDDHEEVSKITPFTVHIPRELKYKIKCIAPIYGHTLTTLTVELFSKYINEHESKRRLVDELKEGFKDIQARSDKNDVL